MLFPAGRYLRILLSDMDRSELQPSGKRCPVFIECETTGIDLGVDRHVDERLLDECRCEAGVCTLCQHRGRSAALV
jgi:hypothetical protein